MRWPPQLDVEPSPELVCSPLDLTNFLVHLLITNYLDHTTFLVSLLIAAPRAGLLPTPHHVSTLTEADRRMAEPVDRHGRPLDECVAGAGRAAAFD